MRRTARRVVHTEVFQCLTESEKLATGARPRATILTRVKTAAYTAFRCTEGSRTALAPPRRASATACWRVARFPAADTVEVGCVPGFPSAYSPAALRSWRRPRRLSPPRFRQLCVAVRNRYPDPGSAYDCRAPNANWGKMA
jgi:hypothetical protein